MAPMIYESHQFIYDSVTQFLIVVATVVMFMRSRKLYSLSLQKGLKYLSNAMLFFIFSFSFKLATTYYDYFSDGIYRNISENYIGVILMSLNMFFAFLGGFYLAYCLIWRKFEIDRLKKRCPYGRVFLVNIAGILIIALDVLLIIKGKFSTPYLFFGSMIGLLFLAIFVNIKKCHELKKCPKNLSPFIALVSMGLGVFILILLEDLFISQFFTIHYYVWGLVTILVLTFFYHVMKILS